MSVPSATESQEVLVVEDNRETQLLLRHLLATRFSVTVATDAATALEEVRGNSYMLILMDINLGDDQDGVDIFQEVRTIDRYETVPVIALTAYALPGDRERFVKTGFDGYLSKPFTKKQLMEAVDGALQS